MAENNNIKLKFGGFEFPSNPDEIKAELSSRVSHSPLINGLSVTEKTAEEPSVIKGKGVFYESDAEEYCTRLSHLMRKKASSWLFCPGIYPMKAYLSDFSYCLKSTGGISYSFTFTEDCGDTLTERSFLFTEALEGENAFDVAGRCGVSVNDIMTLNDIATPFDITQGRRIKIRENSND
ncbi:MAG: LysM peptidoglycan-binding domain-containing protein [Eubacteriales bacterium]|nr:LysM peptidoglycan-binding domain-containing protein [Eubacteriales bacterium]